MRGLQSFAVQNTDSQLQGISSPLPQTPDGKQKGKKKVPPMPTFQGWNSVNRLWSSRNNEQEDSMTGLTSDK
jgi:hypothetical protein